MVRLCTAWRCHEDLDRRGAPNGQGLPRNDPGYEAALIGNIYDRRTAHVTALRDKAISNGKAKYAINLSIIIEKRYRRERIDALRMLAEEYSGQDVE